jgi:large conductance mechanosensitive channel
MLSGFGKFIFRGNVVDLAVAVVIGTAFTAIVNAVVKDLLTPLIALVFGKPDFSRLGLVVGKTRFAYGDLFDAIFSFVAIAAVIYFAVIVPMNAINARLHPKTEETPTTRECPFCLTSIPLLATRCAACTSDVAPPAPAAA